MLGRLSAGLLLALREPLLGALLLRRTLPRRASATFLLTKSLLAVPVATASASRPTATGNLDGGRQPPASTLYLVSSTVGSSRGGNIQRKVPVCTNANADQNVKWSN